MYHVRDFALNTNVMQATGLITSVKTLAERMKSQRAKLGLSQEDVARAAGVSQGTIGNLEGGIRRSARKLVEIANALKVSPEWLSTGKHPAHALPIAVTSPLGAKPARAVPEGGALAVGLQALTVVQALSFVGELVRASAPSARPTLTQLLIGYIIEPQEGSSHASAIQMMLGDALKEVGAPLVLAPGSEHARHVAAAPTTVPTNPVGLRVGDWIDKLTDESEKSRAIELIGKTMQELERAHRAAQPGTKSTRRHTQRPKLPHHSAP